MSDDANAHSQAKPRFDPTINYGHVLTVSSFLIAAASAYYGMRAELQNVDQRVAKGDAPAFVEVCEAGIAVDHVMRRQFAVQRSW
jgi:hypothetical protein